MSDDEADEKSNANLIEECNSNIDFYHDTGFSISDGNAL